MAFKICSIASGSSGNCIYVGTDQVNILVDSGISGKRVALGLGEIGVDPTRLDGIFITHEHSDHIKGVGVLARKYKIPIYATKKTQQAVLNYRQIGKMEHAHFIEIRPDENVTLKDMVIHPFRSFHDAIDPVCYTFLHDGKKISVATDLGCYDEYIVSKLVDSNVLFIEANHDVKMLEVGGYPYFLKKRILSDVGHLSNELSGHLISSLYHQNLSHVILGHLSQENNFPELAYEAVRAVLMDCAHVDHERLKLFVAGRNSNSKLVVVG
ncbi:MBL fold metallo-hydrolase [Vallitalea pronyensis]|uniref:MBL fold metallo-hydrolase n=1 Tax=Vallitalea pronyensis TaxID=1348613 RepID=A0A8J8MLE7_9FIRM|nr:MBL fold metallo-hydrolase [Vallitalea pronyensis]QUI23448.1 MBL fold metallo-hydrolase [Vallitalea pronyensis]